MVRTIHMHIEEHDNLAFGLKKARIESARTNRIDTAEFTFRRATLVALHVPVIGDGVYFTRTAGTYYYSGFVGYVKKIRYEEPNIILECDSQGNDLKRYYDTATYTTYSYEVIANALTTVVGLSGVAMDGTCLDTVPTTFVTDKDTLYTALGRIADATNTEFRYDSMGWLADAGVWQTAVIFYPMTMAGSIVTLEAGKTSGNEIVGRPKWTTDDSEIINNVTVLYKGGSVTVDDDDSIRAYGNRSVTFMRKDIDNATDADNLADAIIANYKDPRQFCECKIKQYLYTITGSGTTYEVLPYYFRTRIDDDLNQIDVSYLDCEKYTIQWPENHDLATFGRRRAFTKGYLQNMETRVYNVEKAVDQDVLTTATPTFAGVQSPLNVTGQTTPGIKIIPANANFGYLSCYAATTQASSFRIRTDAPEVYILLDIDDANAGEALAIYKNNESVASATKIFEIDAAGNIIVSPGINVTGALALAATTTVNLTAGTDVMFHPTEDLELHPTGKVLANADVFAGTNQFLGRNSQSDTLRHSHDAENSTTANVYTKLKTITFASGLGGYYRVRFDLKTNDVTAMSYGKLYKNGVAFGNEQTSSSLTYETQTENFTTSLNPGDTLELYGHNDGTHGVYVGNLRVYYDPDFTAPSANS